MSASNDGWETLWHDPITGHMVRIKDMGDSIAVERTFTASEALFAQNNERLTDSLGKRWGDGQVAASIPLNLYFEKFAEARKNGDSKYIRKLLNDSDYSKLRTFKGRL